MDVRAGDAGTRGLSVSVGHGGGESDKEVTEPERPAGHGGGKSDKAVTEPERPAEHGGVESDEEVAEPERPAGAGLLLTPPLGGARNHYIGSPSLDGLYGPRPHVNVGLTMTSLTP